MSSNNSVKKHIKGGELFKAVLILFFLYNTQYSSLHAIFIYIFWRNHVCSQISFSHLVRPFEPHFLILEDLTLWDDTKNEKVFVWYLMEMKAYACREQWHSSQTKAKGKTIDILSGPPFSALFSLFWLPFLTRPSLAGPSYYGLRF